MIFEFTYTECTSPGPFKKETGFKVKSARIYKLAADQDNADGSIVEAFDTEDEDGNLIQETLNEVIQNNSRLDAATTHLGGFEAPYIGPFSTPEEFASIQKGFIYDLVRFPEGGLAWILARLSTSGPANGRPGNPFHQGILIMNKPAKVTLLNHSTANSELEYPRPIDILTWSGWLNPRGDVQVDASNLRSSDLPFPEISAESMSVQHSMFVAEQGELALDVFSNVARAFMRGLPVALPGKDTEEFRTWVSVVSHLIPPSVSWFCGFGSTWRNPVPTFKELGLPQFYWNKQFAQEDIEVESWAYLVSKVFEYDLDLLAYDSINQVDMAFRWTNEDHVSYALVPLALGVLGLSAEDFGEDSKDIAVECATILLRAEWPKRRGESSFFNNLWESLEEPESLYNTLQDKNQLERKFEALLPPVKDQT